MNETVLEDDLLGIVEDTAEEVVGIPIDVTVYEEPRRSATVVRLLTRYNDEKYGAEISFTRETIEKSRDDVCISQIKRKLRELDETIRSQNETTFEYRDTTITVNASSPMIFGQCGTCYYTKEIDNRLVKHETASFSECEPYPSIEEQQVLEMWMLEYIYRNCACNRKT